MTADYCDYPPQVVADVEITEDRDGERLAYVVGSAAVGRYVLLRPTEHKVLGLLSESLAPGEICNEFQRRYGGTLPLPTLQNFLAKLDDVGILAGQRAHRSEAWGQQLGGSPHFRVKLFNPDRLFRWMVSKLPWIWTSGFLIFTVVLMLLALGLALTNWAELAGYGSLILREHYGAILVAGLLIGLSHEFAHGLTSKAFGGRATEVGVLMIYYSLPALYCNVSGIHLIRQRHRRLWVIAAGIYWQLLVGTVALLLWFVFAPHTLLSNVALIVFLGSVLDVFINVNPLIKLDGYYFLSQWLRLPNLMDRARAYWRGLGRRIVFGGRAETGPQYSRRERVIYAVFGLLSSVYIVALLGAIVLFAGGYLVDSFHLLGLLLTAGIALWFLRGPLQQVFSAGTSLTEKWVKRIPGRKSRQADHGVLNDEPHKTRHILPSFLTWRRLVCALFVVLIVGTLLMPWSASVGNYGTLCIIPGQEAIIRAPESGTLAGLRVCAGDLLDSGATVGRIASLELEDQTAEVRSDLARARAEYNRVQGEMRTREELAARAEVQWRQRQHNYEELTAEEQQIKRQAGWTNYPAAIAVLEADVDLRLAQLAEAKSQLERTCQLHAQAILPSYELEIAETRAATLNFELNAARQRLEAALVDHRRKHTSATADMQLAHSDLKAEQVQVKKLDDQMRAMQAFIDALEQRLDLLQRRQAQFELVTPRAGIVFGEGLLRQLGQHFLQGAEICRVAETHQLLVRIQVPETEIGDVRVGDPVRLKARAFPDQLFCGAVSKIGVESEPDEHRRMTYRVELIVENRDGHLRPGMTSFARIDFDHQMIWRILLHKLKQALRPELWML